MGSVREGIREFSTDNALSNPIIGRSCQLEKKNEPRVDMELHRKDSDDEGGGQGRWEPQKSEVGQSFPNLRTTLSTDTQQGSDRQTWRFLP